MTTDFRPPDWVPLRRALATEFGADASDASAAFWFIGYINGPADVGELRLYEHSVTRRRLALDRDGTRLTGRLSTSDATGVAQQTKES